MVIIDDGSKEDKKSKVSHQLRKDSLSLEVSIIKPKNIDTLCAWKVG